MKVIIEGRELSVAMRAAAKIARDGPYPILSNVMLKASAGSLEITATNMEMWLCQHIPASIEAEGVVCVNAARLAAAEAPNGAEVKLSVGDRMYVSAGASRFRLPVADSADFPIREDGEIGVVEIGGEEFAGLLRMVLPAISRDRIRSRLCGAFVKGRDIVGTNGHQLHWAQASLELGGPAILPTAAAMAMSAMAGGRETIEFGIGGLAILRAGNARLTTKLIDGNFPDWRRQMPAEEPQTFAEFATEDVARAIERIERFQRVSSGVSLLRRGEELVLAINGADGAVGIPVPATFSGEWPHTCLNARYMRETLGTQPKTTRLCVVDDSRIFIPGPPGCVIAGMRSEVPKLEFMEDGN